MIPMVDLRRQYEDIQDEIQEGFRQVLENCAFILGPNVAAFEQEAAEYLGVRHAIGVASGTDALHLALLAAGVDPGDEVITTPFTFIATAEAIRYVGATPVFVDIDPATFNLDPDAVVNAITARTAAILPVHLFGQPADMSRLGAIARQYNLCLIEDCAQSFGATYREQQTGSFGLAGAFSFFPSKNLGAYGDGGMVSTNDDEVARRVRVLRNHGSEVRYHHDIIGYNSRLDELQALVLRTKLKRIEHYNAERRRVAQRYGAQLSTLSLRIPAEDRHGRHVYHQYTILTDRRDELMQALQDAEIASAIYYPIPLHRQKAFAADLPDSTLPVSEQVAAQCLSLPIYPELADEAVDRICAVIRGVLS